ncbi:unnamed protein product [Orchesella dallaii]|uniref:C2H2-type domain-containing protein n=1 Tax=Orchesella dallaii TaxID=48710 RepID=A0ABP1R562_9HEXA
MNGFSNPPVWFGCRKCTRVFPNKENFQKHKLDYHSKRQVNGAVPSLPHLSNSTSLTTLSIENKDNERPCDYTIKTNTKLDASKWKKYFSKQGTCSICLSLKKLSEAQMKSHFEMHLKSYHCKCCSFSTSSHHAMIEHMKECRSPQQLPQPSVKNIEDNGDSLPNGNIAEKNSEEELCSDTESICTESQVQKVPQTQNATKSSVKYRKRGRHTLNKNSRREIVKCRICDVTLFRQSLENHLKTHAGVRPRVYKCKFCDKGFWNALCLRNHEVRHTAKKNRKCGICPDKFSLLCNLESHEKSHFTNKLYTTSITYEEYKKDKTVNMQFQCNFCEESLSFVEIQEHVNTKVCLKCSNTNCIKEFYTVADKMKHMDETVQLKCTFCNDIVDGECNLISHEKNHLGNFKDANRGTSETCTICSKTFKMRSEWINHLRQHNLGIAKPIGRKHSYSVGQNRKLPEDELTCTFCGKIFRAFNMLNQHMSRHLGEKMMKCEHCSYKCVSKSDLRKHSNVHKKTKLFTCSFCSKAFSFQENMRRHVVAIHQKSNLQCPKCDKVFTHNTYLKDHLQSHLKTKSFKCKFCGKAYQNRPNMYRHIREQHINEKQENIVNEKIN